MDAVVPFDCAKTFEYFHTDYTLNRLDLPFNKFNQLSTLANHLNSQNSKCPIFLKDSVFISASSYLITQASKQLVMITDFR